MQTRIGSFWQRGNIRLWGGDCLQVMAGLPDNSVDSIVTDPPYGLSFMGKGWDKGVPSVQIWEQALRVLKPGGHLLAFAGTRTQHRMATAIEDAGFEIRDCIMWVYSTGFPKSMNVGKAIDKAAGGRQWDGFGTALKPALEPITVARKPFRGTVAANVLAHGTGAINVDGCRVGTGDQLTGRWPANLIHDGSDGVVGLFPVTGKSTAVGMKDRKRGKLFQGDTLKNITDRCGFGDSGSAARFFYCAKASKRDRDEGCEGLELKPGGSNAKGYTEDVARGLDRNRPTANHHPTVKPTDLMRYLCRLVTPPGGIVLDPFTGSGSTGKAAILEDFQFAGVELDPGYFEIAQARIAAAVQRVQRRVFNATIGRKNNAKQAI